MMERSATHQHLFCVRMVVMGYAALHPAYAI
jgi:hypothetical protein